MWSKDEKFVVPRRRDATAIRFLYSGACSRNRAMFRVVASNAPGKPRNRSFTSGVAPSRLTVMRATPRDWIRFGPPVKKQSVGDEASPDVVPPGLFEHRLEVRPRLRERDLVALELDRKDPDARLEKLSYEPDVICGTQIE